MKSSRNAKKVTEKILKRYYYSLDKSTAFTGPQNILNELKAAGYSATLGQVKNFLAKQSTYVLYRSALNTYPRRSSVSALMRPGLCVFCDLWDMTRYSADNEGFKWVLVLIGKPLL